MAALICGGVASRLTAIAGSDVFIIEVSSPSIKKLAAMIRGTTSETFSRFCSNESPVSDFSESLSSEGVVITP